ncbi:AAA family ATPase [Pseudomonas sp. Pseu.R1]|uniref:AAA family ATPase n=1 Tax=Pseudomonas sp. Pseu.R1 TaxID=3379818 RepID=UPI003B9495CB
MHIQKLQIENLRSFKKTDIEFNLPDSKGLQFPNVNVLLGDNGLGKTTVLRAVALAILGPLLSGSSGYVPDGLVRKQPARRNGKINLQKTGATSVTADLIATPGEKSKKNSSWSMPDRFSMTTDVRLLNTIEQLKWSISPSEANDSAEHMQFDEQSPAFFIVGYGATRRVEASSRVDESARQKSRLRRYERVAGLFEDHLSLMPLSYWLPAFAEENPGRYKQVIHLINDLLPPSCRIQDLASQTQQGREHLFEMNETTLPFRALSDGFKAYIGWIGDMLFHICQGVASGQKLRQTRGIVMVDEVDLHLHPEWQRTVVPTLAAALPNIQFIFTTHSPLVVGSLTSENLFVLDQQDHATIIKRLPEKVHGKSSEQILLSPYFGLDSTRSEETSIELNGLAASAVSGDVDASIAYLKILAQGITPVAKRRSPSRTARNTPASATADKTIAASRKASSKGPTK